MINRESQLHLNGARLTCATLHLAANGEQPIDLSAQAWSRIAAAREVVEEILASGTAVYGLTTGLGANLSDEVAGCDSGRFAQDALRGRAQALGKPLPRQWVRAAVIARLNAFCIGASGVQPKIVRHILECLNRGLAPVVGETGSIGAGDLCWNAALMCPFAGTGELMDREGCIGDAGRILAAQGLLPCKLGPGDALALANNSSLSAGLAGLAVQDFEAVILRVEGTCALSLEAFQANLSPIDPLIRGLRPMPGEEQAAKRMECLLKDSSLNQPGTARRLQDPLSFRNCLQIHGAAWSALEFARKIAESELNGAGDNPAVIVEERVVRSSGNFLSNQLALGLGTLQRAMVQLANAILARLVVLQSERFTGLPSLLAKPGSGSNGLAPLTKIAEALTSEIHHLSAPPPLWPSVCADGVEDVHSNSALAAKNALNALPKLRRLSAIELIAAAQAIDLGGIELRGRTLSALYQRIREISPVIEKGRPMSDDVMRLAEDPEIERLCADQA